MIGRELSLNEAYSALERLYIRCLGVPIVGLRIRARNVLALIPRDTRYAEILDAGAGTGTFSFELARMFPEARVLGVDLLPAEVEAAESIRRRAGMENVRFERADIVDFGLKDRFDLAVCVDILEHIEDDRSALRSLFASLRPGGLLVLHVPALYRRYPIWRKSLNFDVATHVRAGYEPEEILEKVAEAGFSLRDSGFTYGFFETLANNLSYMITHARMEHKTLYAFAFPLLNALSLLGRCARPKKLGAGVYVVAEKE